MAVPPLILCSIPLCLCRGVGVADIDFTHPHTFQDGPGPDHTFFSQSAAAVALPGPSSWKHLESDTSFRMYFVTIFSWSFLGLERFRVFPKYSGLVALNQKRPWSPVCLLLSRQSLSRSRSSHAETSGRVRLRTRRWETCLHYYVYIDIDIEYRYLDSCP